MTWSGIFASAEEDDLLESENPNTTTPSNKTGLQMYQQLVSGASQISFGEEEVVSTKKPTTLPEVVKQRELSGTLDEFSRPTRWRRPPMWRKSPSAPNSVDARLAESVSPHRDGVVYENNCISLAPARAAKAAVQHSRDPWQ
ncbi:unnamed protein product [Cuscuta campestris]|uniref:DUF4057 domain-containing protein n=1 Tax=Cuscuta campestris TaxID=132261 RepID=A0A484MCJ1_9ASTE|nr:unnamed protein product [Cuscuta campestris]